jgi:hypothetical protein
LFGNLREAQFEQRNSLKKMVFVIRRNVIGIELERLRKNHEKQTSSTASAFGFAEIICRPTVLTITSYFFHNNNG